MNRYPASLANHLSAYGRYGDDQLVHMNRQEVAALDGIAAAFGRELTRNPHTGMKEAFNLFDILPIALSFTGIGAPAAIALSAASGAASAAVEGNDPLQGALMGGLSGALGASFGGGADAATKGAADATTKAATDTVAQAAAQAPAGLEFLGTPTAQTATQSLPGLEFLGTPTAQTATQSAAASPGMLTDIFGPGTDKEVSDALQSIWKKENLPYTIMGGTALSMLPDMFASEGPGRPEYKDIPENFPVNPRMVNPDYDPSLSAFGEQNAFSSGVDYLGRGYAQGGQVSRVPGYKGGGSVDPSYYSPAPEGMMWAPQSQGRRGRGSKGPQFGLVQDPNYVRPQPRNIQPTNMQGLYSGESPFISQGMTQIPLPGGQMGAAPQQDAPQPMPQDMSSFEIATPPGGGPQMYGMPTSGGGMGAPRAGGKAGGQGGGKAGGTPLEHISTPRGPSGGYDQFRGGNQATRDNLAFMSGILRGTPTSKPEEQPQVNPGLQTGIMSTMGPAPGQANPVEPTQPAGPVGMGAQQGFAMGGMVGQAPQMDDRTLVKEAVAAIMGQSPNPEAAIAMFVERFGEQALQMLMQKVGGDAGMGQGRYLEGPGDGLSDSIPAVVDGQQPSALSSGEFVIPADAVSHLGNGDNKSGAKELYNMIDRLRQARTGSPTPPPAINQRSVMPA